MIWLLSSIYYISLLEECRGFSLLSLEKHPPEMQCSVTPHLFLCQEEGVLLHFSRYEQEMAFEVRYMPQSMQRSRLPISQAEYYTDPRRGIPLQHFPGHNGITDLMEFPSYSVTAKTKTNEQVLLINHADDLKEFLFFCIKNLYSVCFFQHIGLFSYVNSKGPTH